jgi:hypothetical protein
MSVKSVAKIRFNCCATKAGSGPTEGMEHK